ncbi:MAG: peptidylprolyl isomerase [Nitrospinota bacterium]|nr:peptidylprolyl isomerase [Nitrospinota bacterium]
MKTGFRAALFLTVVMAGCLGFAGAGHTADQMKSPAKAEKAAKPGIKETKVSENGEMAVLTTRHGKIKIKFLPELAPKHVESMKKLIKDKFYDGTTFHRVIPGFMIQGGDPNSKDAENRSMHGTGGPGYTIKAEFNTRSHKRGIVSMARSGHPDSAGSQFFICVADATFLDGQYTAFGEVVEGMDVADKIVAEPRDRNDNPNERVEMTITLE